MDRFLEFFINHWMLTGLWLVIFAALFAYLQKKAGKTVGIHETTRLINHDGGLVLDIRDKKVFDKGHIVNAINIPLSKLEERISELGKNKNSPLIVVCQMGQQSGDAVKKLEAKGYPQVCKMTGGMTEWQSQGLPLVV
ncbi:MAG: sulfurtransferase [SAR86 cluster bacterium]|uniref:Sulfurtransferase n=1 Tax=SAR86 cluster bacterium TaxID=2030880 RepID=A0A2A5CJN1_9GAMM|nr:rhodanese-like domain-containing protein [Gammaproteobacteria bacterium AH-315-E17]PCJ43728.1 MAG: sulfurtransferase [SAR86 cluster bacterium]